MKMERKDDKIIITLQEAKQILFWLKPMANGKWINGSRKGIEQTYNSLNEAIGFSETPKLWKWKGENE